MNENLIITDYQVLYVEMKSQADFEELTLIEKQRVGNPVKCIVFQSKTVSKKIVIIPLYFRLMRGKTTIGYKEWKTEVFVRDYDESLNFKFSILADIKIKGAEDLW